MLLTTEHLYYNKNPRLALNLFARWQNTGDNPGSILSLRNAKLLAAFDTLTDLEIEE